MDAATIERQSSANAVTAQGHDEDRLAQFGYEQELRRDWGLAHNFGVSFSIISVITGITTLFSYGLNTGACPRLLLPLQYVPGCIFVFYGTFRELAGSSWHMV